MARRPKAKASGYQPCPFEGVFYSTETQGLMAIQSLRLRLDSGVTTRASKKRSLGARFFGRAEGVCDASLFWPGDPKLKHRATSRALPGLARRAGLRLGGRLAWWVTGRKAGWSLRLRLHSGVTTRASKKRSLGARFFGRVEPPIAQDAARWMGYPACQMALAKGRRMRPSQKVSRGAGRG
jgi:hypothetical protein